MRIPFAKVDCSGNELQYVSEVLESGWLTTGSKTRELETRFAQSVGAEYACAVNSGTAALHLALEALGVGPGDRVLVPSMTFTASAEVARYLGAEPVLLDCDYGTRLVTPEIVREAIEAHPNIKALVVVHFAGQAAQLTDISRDRPGILSICRERGIRVVEDAAHAFPAMHAGQTVGAMSDACCFSFYANKTITTGEGGMLTTNSAAVDERARTMRLHGITRDPWLRSSSDAPDWEYDVIAPGFKYNLPDVAAAIGLAQLERAHALRADRERCASAYFRNLAGLPGLELPELECGMQEHAWHLFPVVLTPDSPVDRNRFIEKMAEYGIGTSVHYKPLHRLSYYRERYSLHPESFPNTERIWQGTVSLPLYPSLTDTELEYICQAIHRILGSR